MATKKEISNVEIQDPYLRDTLTFLQEICNMAKSSITQGTKKVEDFYPYFKTTFKDLMEFAKLYLLDECGIVIPRDTIRAIHLTPIDRYMVDRMGYNVGVDRDAKITFRDNIPEGLSKEEKIVAKAILGISISERDQGILENMVSKVKTVKSRYWTLSYYVNEYNKTGNVVGNDKEYFYNTILEARNSGWFEIIPPTDEEKEYNFPEVKVAISISDLEKLVVNIDENVDNSGFDIMEFGRKILGSNFSGARKGLINALLDIGIGFIKAFILNEPDKFSKFIAEIPDKIVFAFCTQHHR